MKRMRSSSSLSIIVIAISLLVVFCDTVYSMSELSSGAKFVSRIERKQELLVDIGQDIRELNILIRNSVEQKRSFREGAEAYDKVEASLSNGKQLDRLESSLSAIVQDSMKDIGCVKKGISQSILMRNLVPESHFQLEKIEKKMLLEQKKKEKK